MAKVQRESNGLLKEIQKVLLDDSDFLRSLVQENLQKIVEAEFESYLQAGRYKRTENRRGYRNGSYNRRLKTRVGTIELEILRDREGNFRTELFKRYQRNEQALVLSMLEMYLQGVSTRKVKAIVEKLCGTNISRSTVTNLTTQLDESIRKWRERSLEKAYPYLVVDARYEYIRDDSDRVNSKAVFIIIGIDENGYREILAVEVGDSESEETWGNLFRQLKSRGLKGFKYLVSDDHKGLLSALRREFQGVSWQRCQVHFMRNFIAKIGKKDIKNYLELMKDIFEAPDIKSARERRDRLVTKLELKKPLVAAWLDEEIEFCFTVYGLPKEHRKRMKSTNMIERLNQEIKRRSRVVRIFPNEASCIRLVGALCMEKSEEWRSGRRYLDMSLTKEKEKEEKDEKIREPEVCDLAKAM